jgi:hypothetical protein
MDWVCGLSEIIKITIYSLEVIFCAYMCVRFLTLWHAYVHLNNEEMVSLQVSRSHERDWEYYQKISSEAKVL